MLEAGWTCEQLEGLFLMITGLKPVMKMDSDIFLLRCASLTKVIQGDIDWLADQLELERRVAAAKKRSRELTKVAKTRMVKRRAKKRRKELVLK